jgi:hypothetical protein
MVALVTSSDRQRMASSAGWPSRIAVRNRRASPAWSGVAGKLRDHPIRGAVLVSRMLSPDAGVAGLMKRLLVVILIRQALGSLAKTGCRQGVSERHPRVARASGKRGCGAADT